MSLFNHTRNIFHLKNHKPFGYCNKEIQECFVINCGKGCLSDGHLRLIIEVYDKSQKRLKLTKKVSGNYFVYHIVCATLSD